jgi:hypothetical protein
MTDETYDLDELKTGDKLQMLFRQPGDAFHVKQNVTLQGEAVWLPGHGWGFQLADGALMDLRAMVDQEGWVIVDLAHAKLTHEQERLADALDNPDLRVAFRDDCPIDSTMIITELAMGEPFPVLVLNSALRKQWTTGKPDMKIHEGLLPNER